MQDLTMGAVEARFAQIIWESEPISSTELARRSEEALGWKKSTCFTVLKRLCNKGIFQNEKGMVTSRLSRQEFDSIQSRQFVADSFQGSLPAFLAAFTAGKGLSPEEAKQLRLLVELYGEE